MTYKKKLAVLSATIAVLAVVYIVTFIFDPERAGSRSDAYTWLEQGQKDRISGISIASVHETISLERKEGKWFVSRDGKNYPARDVRVEDFIETLTKRAPYPVRTSSASSHERLSLTEGTATRVTVTGGAGPLLLNLLIGQEDITGQNVYLRRQGNNEVRSGADIFSVYTGSTINSWFNLRLFPETESGKLDAAAVQRLTVYQEAHDDEIAPSPQIFTRSGKEWTLNADIAEPDMDKVNTYIRNILNTTGNDFVDNVRPSDPLFNNSRLVLEFGDGSIRTIRLGPEEDGSRLATVTGSDLVFSLPAWTSQRLFAEADFFEKQ